MRRHLYLFFAMLLLVAAPAAVEASVVAKIDLSSQRMNVYVNGRNAYSWPVSTARRGYRTPIGTFRPGTMKTMHYSSKYHNSPMPHSIFFLGGYAIHGTNQIKSLGRPASHGCVRLHPSNARTLYNLVRKHGRGKTKIVVQR